MIVNELIITGRYYRVLIDKATKLWQRISYWTHSTDVEFSDGKNAEEKLGAINGITSNVQLENEDLAASIKPVHNIKANLDKGIINNRIQLVIQPDGSLGWKKDGADTVIPFKNNNVSVQYDKYTIFAHEKTTRYRDFNVKKGKVIVYVFGSPESTLDALVISTPILYVNNTNITLDKVHYIEGSWGLDNPGTNDKGASAIYRISVDVNYDQTIRISGSTHGGAVVGETHFINIVNVF